MGYASTMKERDMKILQPIIDKIEALAEGEGVTFTTCEEEVAWVRSRLYTYFAISEQRGIFRMASPALATLNIHRRWRNETNHQQQQYVTITEQEYRSLLEDRNKFYVLKSAALLRKEIQTNELHIQNTTLSPQGTPSHTQ